MYPVDVRMLVNDVWLRSVTQSAHDVTDEFLYLFFGQILSRSRVDRHMEGRVIRPNIPSFIPLKGSFNPFGFIYAVGVDEGSFADRAFVLVVLKREA
jgi:hypothetical protein